MTKSVTRLPIFIGVGILIFSVLLSAVKLSEQRSITSQESQANVSGSVLALEYVTPDIISVILSSDRQVVGLDIVVKFDSNSIKILPSTLTSGPAFITTGGVVDSQKATFSFSALPKKEDVSKNNIVASFKVQPVGKKTTSEIDFVKGENATIVIEKDTGKNILTNTTGVEFTLKEK